VWLDIGLIIRQEQRMARIPKHKVIRLDNTTKVTAKSLANNNEIRLAGGVKLKLRLRRGQVVGGTATTRTGKRAKVYMMKMASDGGTSDICAACVCTGDGGCKCVPVPCPVKPRKVRFAGR
jgi:hypothetical protein